MTPISSPLSTSGTYSGAGSATLLAPPAIIVGPTTITFGGMDRPDIEMQISTFKDADPAYQTAGPIVLGHVITDRTETTISFGFSGGGNKCSSFELVGDTGTANVSVDTFCGGNDEVLTLEPLRLDFAADLSEPPRWLAVPVIGPVGELRQEPHSTVLSHPLYSESGMHDKVIQFESRGSFGFVQALAPKPNDDDVTAFLIVPAPANMDDAVDFVGDTLLMLGLNSGRRLATSWFEARSDDGRLISRTHVSIGDSDGGSRRGVVTEYTNGGIPLLISRAHSSAQFGSEHLRIAIKNLFRARQQSTLDIRLSDVCRGLDAICHARDHATQDLLRDIQDATLASDIRRELANAKRRIHDLTKGAAADDRRLGHDIGNRVVSAAPGKSRNFGTAVASLLDELGLPDAAILDAHFVTSAGHTWTGALSSARGKSVHGTGILSSQLALDSIIQVISHLEDVLARAILKLVGYDGEYQPLLTPSPMSRSVDWVTPSTSAEDLGFA